MGTSSTINKIVHSLVISFCAACLLATWPMSAAAKGNNGHVAHSDIKISKHVDTATPRVVTKKGTTKKTTVHFDDIKGESTEKDHKDW